MERKPQSGVEKWVSTGMVAAGLLLLGLSFLPGWGMKVTLPLIFAMLGAGFGLLAWLPGELRWKAVFYIPAGICLALGFIFLLNALTGDWAAWAYAWLLAISGGGLGTLLASRHLGWTRVEVRYIALGTAGLGAALFIFFGAVAGGLFIQVAAPVLLVGGGLIFGWLSRNGKLSLRPQTGPAAIPAAGLLSEREIEVLELIDQGLTNAQIAARLTVAHSTVKTHINNIYTKLDAASRTQAARRGRELGLIPVRKG